VNVTCIDEAFTGIWHPQAKLSSAAGVYYSMRTQRAEASEMKPGYDEIRIAEEILSALPAGIARACSSERDVLRYAVRGEGLKLRSIVFRRESLRRLIEDPARAVKVEYLQRDLVACAGRRAEFRYPRLHVHVPQTFKRPFALNLPLASMV
jgi:hypothetical protein